MKAEKYYFILAVITGILCVPALGQPELLPHADKPVLLGRANPTLAGIEAVFVAIDAPSADPNKCGWINNLDWKLIDRLQKTDLVVNPSMGGSFWNSSVLRVDVDLLNLQTSQQYVFRVQTSLERSITLPRQRNLHFTAAVWKTEPVMQAVSVQSMPAKVTDVVLEQVEAFVHAWLAANQPGTGVGDVNDVNVALMIAATKRVSPAEYKFVASKNSNVFHRPDCSSAKRIKPANLVGYSSREETLKAGKRPCKRCKP